MESAEKSTDNNFPADCPLIEDDVRASQAQLAVLRTHMANERTFLAWCRTAIAIIAFGFVVERFDLLINVFLPKATKMTEPAGAAHELFFVSLFSFMLGGIIIVLSGVRFLHVRRDIRRGKSQPSVFPEILVVISMLAIIFIIVLMVWKYV